MAAAVYQFLYGYNGFPGSVSLAQFVSAIFDSVLTPSAGLGYLIIFFIYQPRAYRIFKKSLYCQAIEVQTLPKEKSNENLVGVTNEIFHRHSNSQGSSTESIALASTMTSYRSLHLYEDEELLVIMKEITVQSPGSVPDTDSQQSDQRPRRSESSSGISVIRESQLEMQ